MPWCFSLLLDDDTIRSWRKLFEQRGIEGITRFDVGGSASYLSVKQEDDLKAWVCAALRRYVIFLVCRWWSAGEARSIMPLQPHKRQHNLLIIVDESWLSRQKSTCKQRHLAAYDIVEGRDNGELAFLDQLRERRRGLLEKLRLDLRVGHGCRIQIGTRRVHRGADKAIEGADLAGHRLTVDSGLDRAAIAMAQHHDHLGAEYDRAIFDAGHDLRGRDIAGDAVDKHMADALVEDQLYWHAGIGAGKHGGERLLLLGCVLLQDREVVLIEGQLSLNEAPIALDQSLQRLGRALRGLRPGRQGQDDLRPGPGEHASRRTDYRGPQQTTA